MSDPSAGARLYDAGWCSVPAWIGATSLYSW